MQAESEWKVGAGSNGRHGHGCGISFLKQEEEELCHLFMRTAKHGSSSLEKIPTGFCWGIRRMRQAPKKIGFLG
ncbi:hypothetical protein IHE45_08G003700 [Dioscorea alata]|uniref:Uncharacterized protein n=1 Tax=Dioscorea alata TaxID=55571 RepID=A0ACB7VGL1_DIOAL|nr:hypothetical protein IHE45_08G003700 [Dioscorea alata]